MADSIPFTADFRSDTVTKPTREMREAMLTASVGDDVLDGDPTVGLLERTAAKWLGKAGALYVPSGTMANQIAMGSWGRHGDEVILERGAHILAYEAGALGRLHGLQSVTLEGHNGVLDPELVRAAIRPDFIHCPNTAAICVEQTHMGSGGRVLPLENLTAMGAMAKECGVPLHMDGARLAHAVVRSGHSAASFGACVDSVSLCLSKGLGAPVGSIIAGDEAFLERARVVRKQLGGWMRQAGLLAAAGLLALEKGVERLAEDHALARELAGTLDGKFGLSCPAADVETNLVLVELQDTPIDGPELCARLGEHGIGVLPLKPRQLRFVVHRDVSGEHVQAAVAALEAILTSRLS